MWFLIAGFFFGIIGGMGMGGGIVLIPVLTLFLGVSQREAQGLNLLCFLPMAGFALGMLIRQKQIEFSFALIPAAAGLLGSIAGAYFADLIENHLLGVLFGLFLILLGIFRAVCLIGKMLRRKKEEKNVE